MKKIQKNPTAMPKQLDSETDSAGSYTGLNWNGIGRAFVGLLCAGALVPFTLQAAEPDWSTKPVSYYASEQPLSDVLTAIADYQGMKITISDEVDQSVSLTFDKKPLNEAFIELVKMNDLVSYFDGQVMFVYTPSEIKTATVKLEKMSPTAFTAAVKNSGIAVDENNWRVSEHDGIVFLSGTSRFVEQVIELSKTLEQQTTEFVYKWKDRKGQTHYSSNPPDGKKTKFEVLDFRLTQVNGRAG